MVDIEPNIFELTEEAESLLSQERHCEASSLYETVEYLMNYKEVCSIKGF